MLKLVISTLLVSLASTYEVHVDRTKKIKIFQYDDKEVYNEYYGEYTATIYLGTPPQKIQNVVMDTGSTTPWVKVSGWCTQESCPGITPTYKPKRSSSFTFVQEKKVFSYGSGKATGMPVDDTFCIDASIPESCFNAPLHFYGMGSTTQGFVADQGLIGLGPKNSADTFLSQLVQDRNIDSTFSVFYSLDPNMQSTILFGQPNYAKYAHENSTAEDVQWANIATTPNFSGVQWLTQLTSATYGEIPLYNGPSVVFQVDTGTTGMRIDKASFNQLIKTAEAYGTNCTYSNYYQFHVCFCQMSDCSDHPSLNLTVLKSVETGETFTITLESFYTLRRMEAHQYRLMFSIVPESSYPIGPNMVQWIFGQELFHKFYTIFDVENHRVGYIQQKSLPKLSVDLAENQKFLQIANKILNAQPKMIKVTAPIHSGAINLHAFIWVFTLSMLLIT